jgi:hypothetical protein
MAISSSDKGLCREHTQLTITVLHWSKVYVIVLLQGHILIRKQQFVDHSFTAERWKSRGFCPSYGVFLSQYAP